MTSPVFHRRLQSLFFVVFLTRTVQPSYILVNAQYSRLLASTPCPTPLLTRQAWSPPRRWTRRPSRRPIVVADGPPAPLLLLRVLPLIVETPRCSSSTRRDVDTKESLRWPKRVLPLVPSPPSRRSVSPMNPLRQRSTRSSPLLPLALLPFKLPISALPLRRLVIRVRRERQKVV